MSKSIKEVKAQLKEAELNQELLEVLYSAYQDDERVGVQTLIRKSKEKLRLLEVEKERTIQMSQYEKQYEDYEFICGIDEVGRGPLAGPVVAGAVILPKDCDILYLNDSKKVLPRKRELLYDEIMEKAVATGIGIVSPQDIDDINILQATYKAMHIAINNLKVQPTLLLNDAVTIPHIDIKQVPIIKGDAKSISIAAGSIIAKVTRDRLMVEYDKIMPEYGFAGHKGYYTPEHVEAIRTHGVTPIHRASFIKNFIS